MSNIDHKTVEGFGDEWSRLDQKGLSSHEKQITFDKYFSIFPLDQLKDDYEGFDFGCGSGRWANFIAPMVGKLNCIDASAQALGVAKNNLDHHLNCDFFISDSENIPLEDNSQDFGYSLGVLHHIPDSQKALTHCVKKLKSGAPFLAYLYYSFDNRPKWYYFLWKTSEVFRGLISKLPMPTRYFFSQVMAFFIYYPLAKFAKIMEKFGFNINNYPLSFYRNYNLYAMRTDALDRFGTRLEQRFSLDEMKHMFNKAGLVDISSNTSEPYWCVIGYKK